MAEKYIRLFYFPLEPYPERYTMQLSAKRGWFTRQLPLSQTHEHNFIRIEGGESTEEIKDGVVLDATGRSIWAINQVSNFLRSYRPSPPWQQDILYFEDFWHPGIEAIAYAKHLKNWDFKMFALLHAQSVDIHDFTYPMRNWMRHFEKGIAEILDGIFVTSTCLKDLLCYAGVGNAENIHLTGLPYCSAEVKERFPDHHVNREKQVIFTSRFDQEKNPDFFIKVANYIRQIRSDVKFVMTTSAQIIRSNDSELKQKIENAHYHNSNIEVKIGLTKEQYYEELLKSKVQFNCADQDFVSWTLLEATTCGCIPVYPYYLSFPEALQYDDRYLYVKGDVKDAARKILYHIDEPVMPDVNWVYKPFDESVSRMLRIMKGNTDEGYMNLFTKHKVYL